MSGQLVKSLFKSVRKIRPARRSERPDAVLRKKPSNTILPSWTRARLGAPVSAIINRLGVLRPLLPLGRKELTDRRQELWAVVRRILRWSILHCVRCPLDDRELHSRIDLRKHVKQHLSGLSTAHDTEDRHAKCRRRLGWHDKVPPCSHLRRYCKAVLSRGRTVLRQSGV